MRRADFSQLAQQLGYKPSQRMLELRAMQVDWSTQARHPASRQPAPRSRRARAPQIMYEDDLGFIARRRKDTKYKQEEKALARGKLGNVDSWNNQTAFGACGGSPPAP